MLIDFRCRHGNEHAAATPKSGTVYGDVAGGLSDETDESIRMVVADMMDVQKEIPADA